MDEGQYKKKKKNIYDLRNDLIPHLRVIYYKRYHGLHNNCYDIYIYIFIIYV